MRAPNWLPALIEVFESAHGRRFRWGSHDCCQFARRCAIAVTGVPLRADFPTYRTKNEALAILGRFGGMQVLITQALGDAVHPSRAGLGDIVLVDMGMGSQPAVCMGVDCFAPGINSRLEYRKTLTATAAWIL